MFKGLVGRGGQQLVNRYVGFGQLMHEGGIGAVLQQTSDQIGQEIAMRSDRGIDANGGLGVLRCAHGLIDALAHAMEALEFKRDMVHPGLLRQVQHGGQRGCIVCGELRVDVVGMGQQGLRTRQVRQVCVGLAREHGIALQPQLLCALDLCVPVRALHESDAELAFRRTSQLDHFLDHVSCAQLIGLHSQAQAIPIGVVRRSTGEPIQ